MALDMKTGNKFPVFKIRHVENWSDCMLAMQQQELSNELTDKIQHHSHLVVDNNTSRYSEGVIPTVDLNILEKALWS